MPSRWKPRNFYRFILSDDINETCLRIPNKFTREHRKKILLNNVLVIVSDDKVWSLDWMITDDGKLWLNKGWPEFAEHYCLGLGYLLLFNHLGKFIFHVTIFGRSNCEINYLAPRKSPKPKKGIDPSVTQDDQVMGMAETEDVYALTSSQETEAHTDLATEKEKKQSICESARNRALELAKSFQSDNPFYSVTINDSYFGSWGLYIPLQFVRRYLSIKEKCVNCVLQLSDGDFWGPVKCRDYKGYGKLYGANWKKFRDDNHLAVGDVCVLELINDTENVLKVTIYRAC